MVITETVNFHFEGRPFTFAIPEISATETDGITFLDASTDGVVMQQGTQPGQVDGSSASFLELSYGNFISR